MSKVLMLLSFLVSFVIFSNAQDAPKTDYVGKYNFPEGSAVPYVEIKLSDSTLSAESPMGTATLQKIEGDVFSIVEYNGTAEFKRNSEGKVVSVKVTVMGLEMEGTKEGPAILLSSQPKLLYNTTYFIINRKPLVTCQ